MTVCGIPFTKTLKFYWLHQHCSILKLNFRLGRVGFELCHKKGHHFYEIRVIYQKHLKLCWLPKVQKITSPDPAISLHPNEFQEKHIRILQFQLFPLEKHNSLLFLH